MIKKIILTIFVLCTFLFDAQIAHYNQYPTLYVDGYLDLTGASFAYSVRKISDSYTGPLIKLRRASDNSTMDFYADSTDLVNLAAINAWAGGSNLYVVTWYNQAVTGVNRDATQTTLANQPQFFPVSVLPYFSGDGANQYLRVTNGNIQNVTNAGKRGSIFFIAKASNRNQNSFGVLSGSDRWSVHINWSDGNLYFDPGACCNTIRSFANNTNTTIFTQYSLIVGANNVLMRNQMTTKNSGTITTGATSLTSDFLIGAAADAANNPVGHATTAFSEMILFPTDVTSNVYETIEDNEIIFFGLK